PVDNLAKRAPQVIIEPEPFGYAVEEIDVAESYRESIEPDAAQRLNSNDERLGVCFQFFRPNVFETDLMKFVLAAGARLVPSKHFTRVAQPQRSRLVDKTGGYRPGYQRSHFGPQGEQLPIPSGKPIGHLALLFA